MIDRNVFEFRFVGSVRISTRNYPSGFKWRVEVDYLPQPNGVRGGYNVEGEDWDDLNQRILDRLVQEERARR